MYCCLIKATCNTSIYILFTKWKKNIGSDDFLKYIFRIFLESSVEVFDSFCKCLLFFKRLANTSYSISFSFLDNKILLSYYEQFQHIFEIYKVWSSLFRTVIMIADRNSFQFVAGLLEHVSFSSESQPFTHKQYWTQFVS